MLDNLGAEIQRRIALDIQSRIGLPCDRVALHYHLPPEPDVIEFIFETTAKFDAVINGDTGIRDAITRAYMLGFMVYLFRDLEAAEHYLTTKAFWIANRPQSAGRSRWGAR